MKQGFTLIELLVVVLIIGILSAIALPQYEKSVNKARGAEALIAAKTVADSANLFFLERRQYPTTVSELTIKAPSLEYFTLTAAQDGAASKYKIELDSNTAYVTVVVSCSRGKVVSRYCTGSECEDFFSCKSSSNTSEGAPSGACLL